VETAFGGIFFISFFPCDFLIGTHAIGASLPT